MPVYPGALSGTFSGKERHVCATRGNLLAQLPAKAEANQMLRAVGRELRH